MLQFQQLFLTILISVLTILIIVFSIFVFSILKEVRETIRKFNKILDDMGAISGSIAKPISGLAGIFEGIKTGFKAVETIGKFAGRKAETEEEEDE
jgi:Zn-dependent protease